MMMKRSIVETEFDSVSSMASCLMLLSRGHGDVPSSENSNFPNRVFECKTCNRQFPSFQALGGHRASHKKPKTAATAGYNTNKSLTAGCSPPSKPKAHECSICGLEFSIGQALGGHMRRHRAAAAAMNNSNSNNTIQLTLLNSDLGVVPGATQVPVVRKSNSRRVLWLDLNLTPGENDLKLEMAKQSTTPIFC